MEVDNSALLGDPVQPAEQRVFPLGRDVLIKAAKPVATAALITTCTALALAAQGLESNTANPHVAAVMRALLYAYLPLGLVGVLLAVAVKTHPSLIGFSCGFILLHLLIPTVIGALVNIVKSNEKAWVALSISALMVLFTLGAWSYLCAYPKFLHVRRGVNQGAAGV